MASSGQGPLVVLQRLSHGDRAVADHERLGRDRHLGGRRGVGAAGAHQHVPLQVVTLGEVATPDDGVGRAARGRQRIGEPRVGALRQHHRRTVGRERRGRVVVRLGDDVHGPQARRGQGGDESVGPHRQTGEHPLPRPHAEGAQHPAERRDVLQQPGEGELGASGRQPVDAERDLVGQASDDVAVERVEAQVERARRRHQCGGSSRSPRRPPPVSVVPWWSGRRIPYIARMTQAMSQTLAGGPTLPQERRLVTDIPGPRSTELLARKKAAVADGVGTTLPVFVEAAGGGVIVDADGNSLIDLGSGIAVVSVGNAAPAVVRRVTDQVAAFTHTCFMVTPYAGYVEVCEALAELTPGDHAKKSALFNSGAEAVENAVKIARVATGRDAVGVFDHAYHGRTNLTMAMTAKNMPYKNGFGPFASEVYRAPMSYPFRDGLSGEEAAARAIDHLDKQVGVANLACVVIEPILGEGGFIEPAPGFLPALSAWAADNGVVFIADEIQSGLLPHGRVVRVRPRGRRARPGDHRQGHRRRPAARRRHRPRRADGLRPRRRARRHLRRQPGRLRGRPGLDRGDEGARPRRPRPRDRHPDPRPSREARRRAPRDRRRPRPRRHAGHRAVRPGNPGARTPPGPPPCRRTATSPASSPSPAAPGATSSASSRRWRSPTGCSTRRSTWSRRRSPRLRDRLQSTSGLRVRSSGK